MKSNVQKKKKKGASPRNKTGTLLIICLFAILILLGIVVAAVFSALRGITLSADTSQIYDINSNVAILVKTTPEGREIPESAFKTSGGKLKFKDKKITFTASDEGEFKIYVDYSGIKSNKLTLQFEDKEARQLAEEQAEADRIAAEQAETERIAQEQAEAERVAQEQAEAERTAQEQAAQAQNSGNNFNAHDNPEQQQTTSSYVLNTSSMKFHSPTCRDVAKIAPQNYASFDGTRDDVISQGYSPCGHCNP